MTRRFTWVAIVALAVIGFSSLNVYGQREDGPPRDRARSDDGHDGRPDGGSRRPERPPGMGMRGPGGADGRLEGEIRQLREQVSKLTEKLQQLQTSISERHQSERQRPGAIP